MVTARIAIVTGAGSIGMGRAIALRLAAVRYSSSYPNLLSRLLSQDGLDVAVNDLPEKKDRLDEVSKLIENKGRRALVVCGDVTKEEDVKGMVAKVVEELGGLDVVGLLFWSVRCFTDK